jgi:hypothetical protein
VVPSLPGDRRLTKASSIALSLTSDRPYRRALSREEAIAILQERRGTTYDPLVADTFIRVLPDIPEGASAPPAHSAALVQISQSAVAAATATPPTPEHSSPIGQKLTGWVAAYRRTIVNSDAQLDLCDVIAGDAGAHTCLSTAICDGEALAGVITVYREASDPFTASDGQAVELLAPYLARMLVTLRQSRASDRDETTSLRAARDLRVVGGRTARSS